ncbi:type II secretion system protein [Campylobacter hyointestinalis]|uniref:Type II secretion system protein n=1 Tax=Campylobacter hyointestinalis subsp. lawsonii TaxID=91353 RepID=A0AAV6EGX0_CAMHY|nr:type II secretion system protein [Campylobacter hyointestinalis]KAB0613620.1 type II secretion system protein [Campylobacter hyointestinalis subsp. lawsonii]QKF68710.1 putative type II secretion system protein [Campylobacter hyointestinalis subsp. lawsonii]RAZ27652.1 transformation system protein [Campylobacter hyointestinalis subsp. lawsonii]
MKKAFTMIELVFVIVILGILASLAVPKLAATKTDAEVTKIVVEMKNIFDKIAALSISYPELSAKLNSIDPSSPENFAALMSVLGDDLTISDFKAPGRANEKYPWLAKCFIITYQNGALQVKQSSDTSNLCKTLYAHPTVNEWMTNGVNFSGNRLFKEEK